MNIAYIQNLKKNRGEKTDLPLTFANTQAKLSHFVRQVIPFPSSPQGTVTYLFRKNISASTRLSTYPVYSAPHGTWP